MDQQHYEKTRADYLEARANNTFIVDSRCGHTEENIGEKISEFTKNGRRTHLFIEITSGKPSFWPVAIAAIKNKNGNIIFQEGISADVIKELIVHLPEKSRIILGGHLTHAEAIKIIKSLPDPGRDIVLDPPLADNKETVLALIGSMKKGNTFTPINVKPDIYKELAQKYKDIQEKKVSVTKILDLIDRLKPTADVVEKTVSNGSETQKHLQKRLADKDIKKSSPTTKRVSYKEFAPKADKSMPTLLNFKMSMDEKILNQLSLLRKMCDYLNLKRKRLLDSGGCCDDIADDVEGIAYDLKILSSLYKDVKNSVEKDILKQKITAHHRQLNENYFWPLNYSCKQELLELLRKIVQRHLQALYHTGNFEVQPDVKHKQELMLNLHLPAKIKPEDYASDETVEYDTSKPSI